MGRVRVAGLRDMRDDVISRFQDAVSTIATYSVSNANTDASIHARISNAGSADAITYTDSKVDAYADANTDADLDAGAITYTDSNMDACANANTDANPGADSNMDAHAQCDNRKVYC
jgi:hypothetical protein